MTRTKHEIRWHVPLPLDQDREPSLPFFLPGMIRLREVGPEEIFQCQLWRVTRPLSESERTLFGACVELGLDSFDSKVREPSRIGDFQDSTEAKLAVVLSFHRMFGRIEAKREHSFVRNGRSGREGDRSCTQ